MRTLFILMLFWLLGTTGVIAQPPHSSTGYYLDFMPEHNIVEVSNGCTLQLSEETSFVISNNDGDGWGGFGAFLDVPFIGEERTFGVGGIGFYITQDGYYVFTLTNKGEGNWFVSILRSLVKHGNIAAIPDQTYTGSAIEPEITVTDGEKTLTLGTDYTVSYSDNTNVGTAKATITGKGNYSGTVEETFTINAKALTAANVSDLSAQTYTGSAIEPEIVCDGITLVKGTDYEVSYSDNTNVGTAKATITGKGNYSGTVEKIFTITPKVTELGALTLIEDQNGISATIEGNYDQADALTITEDIAVNSVTYNRSFVNDGGAYTIMLPFGFDVTSDIKGTFHTLSKLEPTETETVWKATMSEAITTIEANKPYIFVPSEDFSEMTFSNVTLKKTTSAPLINVCENTNWKLHGVYSQKVWTDDDENLYGFAATEKGDISVGEFVHFVTGATLKPTRCYLEYSQTGFSKSAVVLPEKIIVVFPETSSVIEPNDPENNGDVITPVSEIAPNSGTKVWSYDGTIFIESQPNTDYSVIDITGRTLKTGVTTSTRETVTLSRRAAGIVIVKINGKTFKINY